MGCSPLPSVGLSFPLGKWGETPFLQGNCKVPSSSEIWFMERQGDSFILNGLAHSRRTDDGLPFGGIALLKLYCWRPPWLRQTWESIPWVGSGGTFSGSVLVGLPGDVVMSEGFPERPSWAHTWGPERSLWRSQLPPSASLSSSLSVREWGEVGESPVLVATQLYQSSRQYLQCPFSKPALSAGLAVPPACRWRARPVSAQAGILPGAQPVPCWPPRVCGPLMGAARGMPRIFFWTLQSSRHPFPLFSCLSPACVNTRVAWFQRLLAISFLLEPLSITGNLGFSK